MIIRKIGKIVLGNVTPFQIAAACTLGAMIGFLLGFSQAPGLLIALLVFLFILNAKPAGTYINLPLQVMLHNSTVNIPGAQGHTGKETNVSTRNKRATG